MSRGPSGRIVVEIDPALKERLYGRLEADGETFKTWLLIRIAAFLGDSDCRATQDSRPKDPTRAEHQ